LDGILVANEMVCDAKKWNKELIMLVDFDKAYDSVNCNYLDAVMEKMGFR
jgi:hypothetical protein